MRVYVCGPVTGYSDLNRPVFEAAAEQLAEAGFEAVVPHDFVPGGASREDAMRLCLWLLCAGGIGAVAVLPGFSESAGSCVEMAAASAMGVSVYPIDAILECPGVAGRNADGGNPGTAFSDLLKRWNDEVFSRTAAQADRMNNGYMETGGGTRWAELFGDAALAAETAAVATDCCSSELPDCGRCPLKGGCDGGKAGQASVSAMTAWLSGEGA